MKVDAGFLNKNEVILTNKMKVDGISKIFDNIHNDFVNNKRIVNVAISLKDDTFIPFNEDMDPFEFFLNNVIDYNLNDYRIIPVKGAITIEINENHDEYLDKTLYALSKWSLNGGSQLEVRNDTYLNDKGINKPIRESLDNFIFHNGIINYEKYEIADLGRKLISCINELSSEFINLNEHKSWEFRVLNETEKLLSLIKTYPSIQEFILSNDKSKDVFKDLISGIYNKDVSLIKKSIFDDSNSLVNIMIEQIMKCTNKKNKLNYNIKGIFNSIPSAKEEIIFIYEDMNKISVSHTELRKILKMKEDEFFQRETQSFSWPKK